MSPSLRQAGGRISQVSPSRHHSNWRLQSSSEVIGVLLLVGLCFSWLDIWYLSVYLEQHRVTTSSSSTANVVPPAAAKGIAAAVGNTAVKHVDEKAPIRKLLLQAGVAYDALDPAKQAQLPTWSTVTELYGGVPRIVGLETCASFRATVPSVDRLVAVAGTFNSGTNLLADLMLSNCQNQARMQRQAESTGMRWQVPWGKHSPVYDEHFRLTHKTSTDTELRASQVLPVVTIRDPATWLPSMCRHPYSMFWRRQPAHCPNLVANEGDVARWPELRNHKSVPVTIRYAVTEEHHESMLHHWNKWYAAYYNATDRFPRIMVRYEDLLYYPNQVVQAVCDCVGGTMRSHFKYSVESTKQGDAHGKAPTGYVDALIRYSSRTFGRYSNMTVADMAFLDAHIDRFLMHEFSYRLPSTDTVP